MSWASIGAVAEVTVGELLRAAVADCPARTALVAGTDDVEARRRWSYTELLTEAERAARALLTHFRSGENVALWAPNVPEWEILQFGAALAGVVVVTVNPNLVEDEARYVLEQSASVGVIYAAEHRQRDLGGMLERIRPSLPALRKCVDLAGWDSFLDGADETVGLPHVRPEAPAMIQYTSGTTGRPKGAVLTHRGICNTSRQVAQRSGLPLGGVMINPFPMFHTSGSVFNALSSLWARGTHVLMHSFKPGLALELIESEGGHLLSAVPTMLLAMEEDPDFGRRDLSSLQAVVAGGTTVPPELVRRIEKTFGVWFGVVFGQTELSGVCTMNLPDDVPEDKAETVGCPLDGVELKVIDPVTGSALPHGEQGEVCVRSFGAMLGYFDMPDATAVAIDGQGWLHTNDLGSLDERGYLRITGRLSDMIIRGGENIYPREIEEVLLTHDMVADVAVVGVPDPHWGEQVAAFVRAAEGTSPNPELLEEFVTTKLAAHKRPRAWRFVDSFPLTPSGKIQKFALRESFAPTSDRT